MEEIGRWWPNEKYMFLGAESKATIEARVGGRVYNGHPDGREYAIGDVFRYEPGARLTFTWNHGDDQGTTEIDVRFTADHAGTRVDLEHGGWSVWPTPSRDRLDTATVGIRSSTSSSRTWTARNPTTDRSPPRRRAASHRGERSVGTDHAD